MLRNFVAGNEPNVSFNYRRGKGGREVEHAHETRPSFGLKFSEAN